MSLSQINIKDVRKFGTALAIILLVIGSIHLIKGHVRVFAWISVLASVSLAMGVLLTRWLIPFYLLFTKVAHAIGWFNTRLLLSIVFYLLITPLGLIMRLLGKDPLEKRIEKEKDSYWVRKAIPAEDVTAYEKQF